MAVLLSVSVFVNALLFCTCWSLFKRWRAADSACRNSEFRHREDSDAARQKIDSLNTEYRAFSDSVAETLREVRRDVQRNYRHVHDGHLLDRLAWELQDARGPVRLGVALLRELDSEGYGRFVEGGMLMHRNALALAWHVHEQERRRAGALAEVVQESCGKTDRAVWLGKMLALYERICGGDKAEAIRSLSVVLVHWERTQLEEGLFFNRREISS